MRIGLLGAGTVGSAVLDLLAEHAAELSDRLGEPLEVRAVVVQDAARPRRLVLPPGCVLTADAGLVVDAADIEVVVEAMGGSEPALAYALRALECGKSLVTANKALVAGHAPRLFAAAARGGGDVRFEAAVGAAVPVVGAMQEALSAARIVAIAGVLNGSTNYLLAELAAGVGFDVAAERARRLGYLEADPSDDVDGHDSARKIAILASLAGHRHVGPERVSRRSLRGLEPQDLEMAAALGATVKYLAVAERGGDAGEAFTAWVAPTLVPAAHPLAAVRGAANAVLVTAAPAGETLLAGQGAGGGPTASAVVGDILAIARQRRAGGRGPLYAWRDADADADAAATAAGARLGAWLVRVALERGADRAAVAAAVGRDVDVAALPARADDWLAARSRELEPATLGALTARLAHLPGVAGVGPALVAWRQGGRRDEAWWLAPQVGSLAGSAREGASGR